MRRRGFIAAALAATGFGGATVRARVRRESAPAQVPTHVARVGQFVVRVSGTVVTVTHSAEPERVLWRSGRGSFLQAAQVETSVREIGIPMGSFEISDRSRVVCGRQTVDQIDTAHDLLALSGKLSGSGRSVDYRFEFRAASDQQLRFAFSLHGADAERFNKLTLRGETHKDEGFFGFGEQMTYFNQKGRVLPILVQEHGVGRGQPIITTAVDLLARGGWGHTLHHRSPGPSLPEQRPAITVPGEHRVQRL